jgi:hypothetical protein
MKKLHVILPYIIILALLLVLGFMFKLISDKPKEKIVYISLPQLEEVLTSKQVPNSEKPAIPVEPYLIQQYCQKNIKDNNYDSRTKNWDIEIWNEGFVNYTCKKNPNEGFAIGVLCSELFDQKIFLGKATEDQKNCIFEAN